MSQRAHWCLTVPEEVVCLWTDRSQEKWKNQAGKQDKPLDVPYNSIVYKLWIGHKEGADENTQEPHYHVLLSCPPQKTMTKSKAFTILNNVGFSLSGVHNIYCQELQSTVTNYKNYMFKTGNKTKGGNVDYIITKAADALKAIGNITKENLRKVLIDEQGPTWYSRNKNVVETYIGAIDNFQQQRMVDVKEDMDEIVSRTKNTLMSYYEIILANIRANGFHTKHEYFANLPDDLTAKYITAISILPYLFQRCVAHMDNIPGLYFYGDAGAGKSLIFGMGRSYKMVAMDSIGIAKFKLEGCQSGFVIDDAKANTLNDPLFMSTVRQLVLGGFSRIKVHSDTQQIKGFVNVTSNDVPRYLSDDDPSHKTNNDAWKRRFIALRFNVENLVDFDRQGNEFDYTQALEQLAIWFTTVYDVINDANEKTEEGDYARVLKTLTPYYRSMYKYTGVGKPVATQDENVINSPYIRAEQEKNASKRKSTAVEEASSSKQARTDNGDTVGCPDNIAAVVTREEGELEPSQLEDGELPWTQTQSVDYDENAFMRR